MLKQKQPHRLKLQFVQNTQCTQRNIIILPLVWYSCEIIWNKSLGVYFHCYKGLCTSNLTFGISGAVQVHLWSFDGGPSLWKHSNQQRGFLGVLSFSHYFKFPWSWQRNSEAIWGKKEDKTCKHTETLM